MYIHMIFLAAAESDRLNYASYLLSSFKSSAMKVLPYLLNIFWLVCFAHL